MLWSFLHFLKAKQLPKITPKSISHKTQENKCHSSEELLNTVHMNFKSCFRHLALLEKISFEQIFKTVAQKFAIQIYSLCTKFVSACYLNLSWFLLNFYYPPVVNTIQINIHVHVYKSVINL